MTKNFFDNVKTALNFTELNYMFFDKRKRSTIYTIIELPIFDKTKSPRQAYLCTAWLRFLVRRLVYRGMSCRQPWRQRLILVGQNTRKVDTVAQQCEDGEGGRASCCRRQTAVSHTAFVILPSGHSVVATNCRHERQHLVFWHLCHSAAGREGKQSIFYF